MQGSGPGESKQPATELSNPLPKPRQAAAALDQPDRAALEEYEARVLAYESRPRSDRGPRSRQRGPRRRRRPARTRFLVRRVVALAIVAFLALTLSSYASSMLRPSSVGLSARSVEWVRDHGGAWLVNGVERIYYSLNGPSTGGPPLKSLPSVGLGGASPSAGYTPVPLRPAINPALPGEGQWRSTTPGVAGVPPVLVTTFRPDPAYPQLAAGVAWIDRSRTRLRLYPGRYEPPSATSRGPMEVPPQDRRGLLATFNSGFKLEDSHGGFAAGGHVFAPLHRGLATLVGLRDGAVDVRAWTGGAGADGQVAFARQNLPLIIDHGRLNPNLNDGPQWGATLGNAIRVWRSGVGVDRRGDLLYAAADSQTVTSLAQILRRAGAVRAMELDINYQWTSFNTYAHPGGGSPLKLLPGMDSSAARYLSPDDRDFFAVFARPGR